MALPQDIDAIDDENIIIYNIDSLKKIIQDTKDNREEEAKKEADKLAKEIEVELNSFDENLRAELGKILDKYLYRHMNEKI